MIVTAKAPGKLYLAGEYAITLPRQRAIIFGVNKYITVTMQEISGNDVQLESDQLGTYKFSLNDLHKNIVSNQWQLVLQTIQVIYDYHFTDDQKLLAVKIKITSALTFEGKKLGLGSSAAVVSAIIKAFNTLWHLHLTKQQQFKLGVIVMLSLPQFSHGSMGDLAVAVYGGMILYQKFDNHSVAELMRNMHDYKSIINTYWPELTITELSWPSQWQLVIGWTGEPADTQQLLDTVVSTKEKKHAKETLAAQTLPIIDNLVKSILTVDFSLLIKNILANQTSLINYADQVNIDYLTNNLFNAMLIAKKIGVPAKISGAGAGDNVVAVAINNSQVKSLKQSWRRANIVPLPLEIAILGE